MAALPLEQFGSTPRERRLLGRLGAVIAAIVVGFGAGIAAYAWANEKFADADEFRVLVEKVDLLVEDCYRRGGCQKK